MDVRNDTRSSYLGAWNVLLGSLLTELITNYKYVGYANITPGSFEFT